MLVCGQTRPRLCVGPAQQTTLSSKRRQTAQCKTLWSALICCPGVASSTKSLKALLTLLCCTCLPIQLPQRHWGLLRLPDGDSKLPECDGCCHHKCQLSTRLARAAGHSLAPLSDHSGKCLGSFSMPSVAPAQQPCRFMFALLAHRLSTNQNLATACCCVPLPVLSKYR